MNEELKAILQASQYITWPVAAVVVAYFMKPVWGAIGNYFKKKSDDSRIQSLQQFQYTAETNHFTDLERLMKDMEDVRRRMEVMGSDIGNNAKNIAYLMGRIKNGYHDKN